VNRKKLVILVSGLAALGAVAFVNLRYTRTNGVEVTVETIQRRDLEAVVSASGKIQPKRSVNISADTMGRVVNLAVNEGDRVRKGQFLLQIDPRNLRTQVDRGEASLAAARSQLRQFQANVESARVALKMAADTLQRQQDLWSRGLTTREALDQASTQYKMREAELRVAEQQVATQEKRIAQELALLESARYDLNKVRIESPIDGIVTRRNIEEGETVVIGTMNNPGTVLLTIADMSVIQAEVEVDETDIPSLAIGQRAKVTIDALPGKSFSGHVTEIGNSPIQTAGAAGARQATNFKVVVTLDDAIPEVRPGFTCTADITTATRQRAVAVPIQATIVREMVVGPDGQIVRAPRTDRRRRRPAPAEADGAELPPGQTRKELEGVFVVRDGRAEFVPIKTGIAGEKYFEVLEGLKEGDLVVTGPLASVRDLKDGDPVKVQPTGARSRSGSGR
jgi:HlyD family secretion protein